jgi:hypothetical protein
MTRPSQRPPRGPKLASMAPLALDLDDFATPALPEGVEPAILAPIYYIAANHSLGRAVGPLPSDLRWWAREGDDAWHTLAEAQAEGLSISPVVAKKKSATRRDKERARER